MRTCQHSERARIIGASSPGGSHRYTCHQGASCRERLCISPSPVRSSLRPWSLHPLSAHAAARDGNCEDKELCLYYNRNHQGSVSERPLRRRMFSATLWILDDVGTRAAQVGQCPVVVHRCYSAGDGRNLWIDQRDVDGLRRHPPAETQRLARPEANGRRAQASIQLNPLNDHRFHACSPSSRAGGQFVRHRPCAGCSREMALVKALRGGGCCAQLAVWSRTGLADPVERWSFVRTGVQSVHPFHSPRVPPRPSHPTCSKTPLSNPGV